LKALCVVFHSLGKGFYNLLGKILGRNRSLIYRWIREAGRRTAESAAAESRQLNSTKCGILFESKKESFGSSKPLIAVAGGQSPGFSAVVIA
jgi:hypothetical protein